MVASIVIPNLRLFSLFAGPLPLSLYVKGKELLKQDTSPQTCPDIFRVGELFSTLLSLESGNASPLSTIQYMRWQDGGRGAWRVPQTGWHIQKEMVIGPCTSSAITG